MELVLGYSRTILHIKLVTQRKIRSLSDRESGGVDKIKLVVEKVNKVRHCFYVQPGQAISEIDVFNMYTGLFDIWSVYT